MKNTTLPILVASFLMLAIACLSCYCQSPKTGSKEKDIGTLIADLKDEDVAVRKEAAETLRKLKDRRAIPALIETYRDTQYESFIDALWALGEFQDARVHALLLDALKHEDWRARTVSAKLLDQRGWKPANPEQKIRRLIALEKWQEAASTGPSAKPIPDRPNLTEGLFELDVPIIIALDIPDDQKPKIGTYPWIEFRKTNDHMQVTLEILIASWPMTKCTIGIDIMDTNYSVLKRVEMTHTTSGVLGKFVLMERQRLHSDLGPWSGLSEAARFRFSIMFEKTG